MELKENETIAAIIIYANDNKPMSKSELKCRGMHPDKIPVTISNMHRKGLLTTPNAQKWSLTPLGVASVHSILTPALLRCRGVPTPMVQKHNCLYWEDCLHIAAKASWDNFGCQNCPYLRKEEI